MQCALLHRFLRSAVKSHWRQCFHRNTAVASAAGTCFAIPLPAAWHLPHGQSASIRKRPASGCGNPVSDFPVREKPVRSVPDILPTVFRILHKNEPSAFPVL